MPSFPLLKSGAVAQYPLDCTLRSDTQTVRFLDGSTQQYRLTRALRRWKISLAQVDARELDSVIDFVEQQEGAPFAFTDPIGGDTAPKCVLSDAGLEVTAIDEWNSRAVLVIEEVL